MVYTHLKYPKAKFFGLILILWRMASNSSKRQIWIWKSERVNCDEIRLKYFKKIRCNIKNILSTVLTLGVNRGRVGATFGQDYGTLPFHTR